MNEWSDSEFGTKYWNIVKAQSNTNYIVGNEIIYNTELLKSNFYDNNDAYILVKDDATITWHAVTQVVFKLCTSFIKCIIQNGGITIRWCWRFRFVHAIEYSS